MIPAQVMQRDVDGSLRARIAVHALVHGLMGKLDRQRVHAGKRRTEDVVDGMNGAFRSLTVWGISGCRDGCLTDANVPLVGADLDGDRLKLFIIGDRHLVAHPLGQLETVSHNAFDLHRAPPIL